MRTPYYREQALEGIAREVITAYDPNLYYGVPRMIPIEDIIEAQGITLEYQCLRKTGCVLGETIFDDGGAIIYDYDIPGYLTYREGKAHEPLFPSDADQPMTENGLRCSIANYNRKRGVEKTSIHLFRHTFARKYLVDCGGNAFTLQKLLGHSTLDMTKHYCAIYDVDLIKDFDEFSPLSQLSTKRIKLPTGKR